MGAVDEAALKAAVKARRDYIIGNLNTMTLKSCRKTLEEDLGLESGELKPFKDLLGSLIDKIIAKHKAAEQEAAPMDPEEEAEEKKPAVGKTKRQPKDKKAARADRAVDDEDGQPIKRRKQDKQPTTTSGPRQYSRAVVKLRDICKAATITIPPSLYVKNKGDAALQAALEALLAKHGLDGDAGQADIQRVRSALQVQRDLDGIDTSNIIEGGRRPRRAAAGVSYKALVDPGSEEEEEEEDGGSSSEEDGGSLQSGSKAEASDEEEEEAQHPSKAAKAVARPSPDGESESEDEASSSKDGSGWEASEGEDDTAALGSSKERRGAAPDHAAAGSPDENAAARGNTSGSLAEGQPAKKARPAVSLDDSDGEGAPAGAAAKRRALVDWSDDED